MRELKSARLRYRPLRLDDFEDYWALDQDPEVMKFIRGCSVDRAECMTRFQRYLDYEKMFPDLGAAAVHTHAGEFIGLGVVIHIELNTEQDLKETGYRLKKSAWGQGYATEIAETMLKYAMDELKLPEIWGTTDPNHVVSQKILQKVGLIPRGMGSYYNGSTIFSLIQTEWKNK